MLKDRWYSSWATKLDQMIMVIVRVYWYHDTVMAQIVWACWDDDSDDNDSVSLLIRGNRYSGSVPPAVIEFLSRDPANKLAPNTFFIFSFQQGSLTSNFEHFFIFPFFTFSYFHINKLTCSQRRKMGQSRMRIANWWYARKEYPIGK